MELFTAITVFVAIFIISVACSSLYQLRLSSENKINPAIFLSGAISGAFLSALLPRGNSELAIFSSLFGIIIAFYNISEQKQNGPALPGKLTENIRWAIYGIFFYTAAAFLYQLYSSGNVSLIYVAIIPPALYVGITLSRKVDDLSPSLKIFSISFLVLAIPAVYQSFADFMHFLIHEVVHLNYVTFMFPDHPFLEPAFYQAAMNTVYNPVVTGFAIFTFVIALSLLTLAKVYWRLKRFPESNGEIEVRKQVAHERKKWRTFLALVLVTGLVMFGSAMGRMKAEQGLASEIFPVKEENGYITLSTSKPLYQISEGAFKKYKYDWQGQPVVFILFRWNGKLKTVMDYCEFCKNEEEGYLFKNGQLICKVCQTAIPPATVGIPGGCNPVPVRTQIDDYLVKIKVSELVNLFKSKKAVK